MAYSFQATIKNKLGIHARVAALLSKTVSKYNAEAYIIYKDSAINLKHLIEVISLSITQNAEIIIKIEGDEALLCGKELESLIDNNFGEKL